MSRDPSCRCPIGPCLNLTAWETERSKPLVHSLNRSRFPERAQLLMDAMTARAQLLVERACRSHHHEHTMRTPSEPRGVAKVFSPLLKGVGWMLDGPSFQALGVLRGGPRNTEDSELTRITRTAPGVAIREARDFSTPDELLFLNALETSHPGRLLSCRRESRSNN